MHDFPWVSTGYMYPILGRTFSLLIDVREKPGLPIYKTKTCQSSFKASVSKNAINYKP